MLAPQSVHVSGSSVTHLKVYRHWDSSAHTPLQLVSKFCTFSHENTYKKLGFSMLLSSYIARCSTRFPSTELSFSLLPPLQLVRFFFSGFIYDFLSENPCISFVFNILKFSNSGFFQSSAAWLMANTPELHFLHYLGWCVCLETLFNCCFSFSPLLFSNFPIYPF